MVWPGGDAGETVLKVALSFILLAVLTGLGILVFGALSLRSLPETERSPVPPRFDSVEMLERFRDGLRIPTISQQPGQATNGAAFLAFRALLERSFPRVHAELEKELISNHTLVFKWLGQVPSAPATVLLAHQDVVPVDGENEDQWTHPPFAAQIDDGYVWARGALDDKLGLFAILEAVEILIQEGFVPQRTLYLVFGHDEELGGAHGASEVARLFVERDISLGLVLDEGGALTEGQVPGVDQPVALVGAAEKGYLTALLEVKSLGGHSSAPPAETAIGILAKAISRLEETPFEAHLDEVGRAFFERGIGPSSTFGMQLVYGNLWFFEPILLKVLESNPTTAAMVRTTVAPTMMKAGTKENVLPTQAMALVNFRIFPGETEESVLEEARRIVADPRVALRALAAGRAPSPASSLDSQAWRTLERTIYELFPEAIVAPYLVLGGTDSRYFRSRCDCVYRFLPVRLGADSMSLIHGTNERVAATSLVEAAHFYHQLIQNADSAAF